MQKLNKTSKEIFLNPFLKIFDSGSVSSNKKILPLMFKNIMSQLKHPGLLPFLIPSPVHYNPNQNTLFKCTYISQVLVFCLYISKMAGKLLGFLSKKYSGGSPDQNFKFKKLSKGS